MIVTSLWAVWLTRACTRAKKLWFDIGRADNVSFLGREGPDGTLESWRPGRRGTELTQALRAD